MTVCAPPELDHVYDYAGSGAHFVPLPRLGDPATVTALRNACIGADVVHAHGLHASVRAALALSGTGGGGRTPLVTTWDSRHHVHGARGGVLRLLERKTVRAATVVLATSSELVDRARRRGPGTPGSRPSPCRPHAGPYASTTARRAPNSAPSTGRC